MSQPNGKGHYKSLTRKIKQHEANLKFLEGQTNRIDQSLLDLQVSLGTAAKQNGTSQTNEETVEKILQQQNSAAAILCRVKNHHATQASSMTMIKDVLGIVATLGKVDDDNLSRLLSEYLGLDTMLAIVCGTYEAVQALEKYDSDGNINCYGGVHGLGSSMARKINGRFLAICLEELSPYAGNLIADDPQRKLALPKPKLPNGKCPAGFIDFAVNMINLDSEHVSFLTSGGHGLRETLLYTLFSCLQIYTTRKDMLNAFSCIDDGALSLDGGMIKKNGAYALGNRKDVEVKFGVNTEADNMSSSEDDEMKRLKWERSNIAGDMKREEELLVQAKAKLRRDKQGFKDILTKGSSATFPRV